MKIADFYNIIDGFAPFSHAYEWDNCGLLLGDKNTEVTRALLALDITSGVITHAEQTGANLIITHHPVIFSPLKSISAQSLVYRLIRAGISVISAHTNLDIAKHGVNDCLAEAINLINIRNFAVEKQNPYKKITVYIPKTHSENLYTALLNSGLNTQGNYTGCAFLSPGEGRFKPLSGANPFLGAPGKCEKADEIKLEFTVPPTALLQAVALVKDNHPYEEPVIEISDNYGICEDISIGRIGELASPMDAKAFAQHVQKSLNTAGLRYTDGGRTVKTVAVLGGSGASYVDTAISMGADALVTGESKHSIWLDCREKGFTLVDAGHFSTENVVLKKLKSIILESAPGAHVDIALSGDGVHFIAGL